MQEAAAHMSLTPPPFRPGDQRRKVSVPPTLIVYPCEHASVDGEGTRWYISRSHLLKFRDRGHERIALLVGRFGVVQHIWVDGLSGALKASKFLERPHSPELLGVQAEDELLATLDPPETDGSGD